MICPYCDKDEKILRTVNYHDKPPHEVLYCGHTAAHNPNIGLPCEWGEPVTAFDPNFGMVMTRTPVTKIDRRQLLKLDEETKSEAVDNSSLRANPDIGKLAHQVEKPKEKETEKLIETGELEEVKPPKKEKK